MTAFEPGEGWRNATDQEIADRATGVEYLMQWRKNGGARYWVREEPVPALPTEPYTVIRVTWARAAYTPDDVLILEQDGRWGRSSWAASILAKEITGFEVLAEPVEKWHDGFISKQDLAQNNDQVRRETAKAVLDRLINLGGLFKSSAARGAVAREFGVES